MGVTWITPTDVTPSQSGAWVDVDCSGSISGTATGVIIAHDQSTGSGSEVFGYRKNGSTDTQTGTLYGTALTGLCIGVDGSGIFEMRADGSNRWDIWLIGYWESDAYFFTNAPTHTTGSGWTDWDISGDSVGGDTATGAFVHEQIGNLTWGFRKNGSADTRESNSYYSSYGWAGCDGSEILEEYAPSAGYTYYLNGYTKDNCTWDTNSTEYSVGTADGGWYDMTALPAGAGGGFFETSGGAYNKDFGIRENGTGTTTYGITNLHAVLASECDGSRVCEGAISDLAVDFWLMGYTTGGGAPPAEVESQRLLIGTGI